MTYEEFINNLNSRQINKIKFFIQEYSHYKSCSIEHYDSKSIFMGREISIDTIEVKLTSDNSEIYRYYKRFREDFKLFKIGKQTYTLKQMWDKITITDIERNSF